MTRRASRVLAVTTAVGVLSISGMVATVSAQEFHASTVVDYEGGTSAANTHTNPSNALGPPDGAYVSLGEVGDVDTGTFLVVSFSSACPDGPGNDLRIRETGVIEVYSIEVSSDGSAFTAVGNSSDSAADTFIDFNSFGVSDITHVRMTDDRAENITSPATDFGNGSSSPGADIDAVTCLNPQPEEFSKSLVGEPGPIGVGKESPTQLTFKIDLPEPFDPTQDVVDVVPAEWNVVSLDPSCGTASSEQQGSGKSGKLKPDRITWDLDGGGTPCSGTEDAVLLVVVETDHNPGRGHRSAFYEPTSCEPLQVNEGAEYGMETTNELYIATCYDEANEDCVDEDGDAWSVDCGDCDDGDPDVYPLAVEVCDNLIDDDCDGAVDCDDSDCPTEFTELMCDDGLDNDCDLLTDGDDSDCVPE